MVRLCLVCYMAIAGKTNKEIAKHLDISPAIVSSVLRQPWARKFITEEARAMAGGEVMDMLKGEAGKSVKTLIELRDDGNVLPSTRLQAANAILDRALGKPAQQVVNEKQTTYNDAAKEAESIDRELAELRRRHKVIDVTGTSSTN